MGEMADELKKLPVAHQVFLDKYCECWNGPDAYLFAYPKCKTRISARAAAARLLADVSVQAHLQARLAEIHMSSDEALQRLADMARGDLAEFMDISSMGFNISLLVDGPDGQKVPNPKTKLIKRIKQKTTIILGKKESDEDREIHETEIELHDPQTAIDKILRVQGAYKNSELPAGEVRLVIEYVDKPKSNPDADK